MDKLIITGGIKLQGEVIVSPAKNSSLPLMCATLLCPFPIQFKNLPELNDLHTLNKLLQSLGVVIANQGMQTTYDATSIHTKTAEYNLVRTMRASVLVLGPLLARFGEAKVSLPGGCAIGARPVDIHLLGLEKMGAKILIENGYISAKAEKLVGAHIPLPFPSVGATENLMMAATLARGETIIENAACEPEISDLANFLKLLGVKISGEGTSKIIIQGIDIQLLKPQKSAYRPIGDRIEAATYIIAALMTDGEVKVCGFVPEHLSSVLEVLKQMGADIYVGSDFVEVKKSNRLKSFHIETAPYPGFPTDVQAQMMALMTLSEGSSLVTEAIFENRFMHVPEMLRMGCDITLKGNNALIKGVEKLNAAPVMCTDLRASAALILCALRARGESQIQRVYHLDRGYEKLDQKLKKLGANIKRLKG